MPGLPTPVSFGREVVRGTLQLLFPSTCNACRRPLAGEQRHFCTGCRSIILSDALPTCPRCASTVGAFSDLSDGCKECRNQRFHFAGALRLGCYDGRLREVILRIKHHDGEGLAENLAQIWAEHSGSRLRSFGATVVVPVPLHWWRHLTRGYNQSAALAQSLSEHLGLPCQTRWLRRIRPTPKQTSLAPSQRRENVRGAFRARSGSRLRGQTVLLVDDVMTTGSTCDEAARALRAAGAAQVYAAVLARA